MKEETGRTKKKKKKKGKRKEEEEERCSSNWVIPDTTESSTLSLREMLENIFSIL
jgi:hypothetical protein